MSLVRSDRSKMKRLTLLVCASVFVPALAAAQPKTPDDWYKEGETQYNLGNFPGAVDAFKKGFELETNDSKKAAYLYNVAQAYRQAKDCGNAQFFYKRYLALKDNDTASPSSPTSARRSRTGSRSSTTARSSRRRSGTSRRTRTSGPTETIDPDDKGTGDKGTDDGTGDKGKGKQVADGR